MYKNINCLDIKLTNRTTMNVSVVYGIFAQTVVLLFLSHIRILHTKIVSSIISSTNFDWNRSFSEPDLTDTFKHHNRFTIKHPHEYISVDDLKFFRRKKPPDFLTQSSICLYNKDEPVLPFSSFKSEYRKKFRHLDPTIRPRLLRRATSLRLEGLMHHQSEHQDQYHWYTPEDCRTCRTYPIRNPENLRVGGDSNMDDAEYRSSYISYPMVDRTAKILPREMFRIDPEPAASSSHAKNLDKSPGEIAAIHKLTEDKFKRDVAAQEQQKCHLQQRANVAVNYNAAPSEYKRQFVQFPIEKAHSIPQLSHFKMHGDFVGVPEYQDSFKMYANYSKSAPIKKVDNLRISGAEVQASPVIDSTEVPEYREQFRDPPKNVSKEKSLKTDDHLHPRGEFTKDVPEYYESFRDPQVKQMPERGKCREPYLRLKGKIEFNPEYRNTYLDFPRSRPIVRKPASSFRLPTSSTTTTTTTADANRSHKQQKHSPRRKYKSSSPTRFEAYDPNTDITTTPEYRRANYNYQIRERTPPRKVTEAPPQGHSKITARKTSSSSMEPAGKPTGLQKRRPSRNRQTSILDTQSSFENMASRPSKKPAKYGRRASVLQNAANCRENSSVVEGNPKYTLTNRKDMIENRDSFVVLNEPCKRSNWMKKSWYD